VRNDLGDLDHEPTLGPLIGCAALWSLTFALEEQEQVVASSVRAGLP
jgi:hypothetical protein